MTTFFYQEDFGLRIRPAPIYFLSNHSNVKTYEKALLGIELISQHVSLC
jgi:hypothetical protein